MQQERVLTPSSGCTYTEVEAKSLLRESALVDPWFLGCFGANLYRGCEHGCIYCDGRAERYYVEGDFARNIQVKRNALVLAERELARRREPGFLFLGGGVSDSYQPAEATYGLARGLLHLAAKHDLGVHVLTKSALVERDLDLIEEIAQKRRAILSFSLQSVDERVRERLEPGAAPVSERLRLLRRARDLGIYTGVMAMPILPGISDSVSQIDELVRTVADAGAQFVCFGGLTLRPGRQKQIFNDALELYWPELLAGYIRAYGRSLASGAPDPRYTEKIAKRFAHSLTVVNLPARIPRSAFQGVLPLYTEASVLLEHIETARRLCGERLTLAKSGYRLAQWAHRRVASVARRKGYSYRDVEDEFLERLNDGSLMQVAELDSAAYNELLKMDLRRMTNDHPARR